MQCSEISLYNIVSGTSFFLTLKIILINGVEANIGRGKYILRVAHTAKEHIGTLITSD